MKLTKKALKQLIEEVMEESAWSGSGPVVEPIEEEGPYPCQPGQTPEKDGCIKLWGTCTKKKGGWVCGPDEKKKKKKKKKSKRQKPCPGGGGRLADGRCSTVHTPEPGHVDEAYALTKSALKQLIKEEIEATKARA